MSSILILILIILIFWMYNELSKGKCECSKHLVGKVVIVTGSNTGIGYETAMDLAERGARVILGCRDEQRGTAARDKIVAATGNHDVHFRKLDLASFKSVRDFAADILKTQERLDILINNAGIYFADLVKTDDGVLLGMQTNHYSPFLLTCLLLPLLKTSAPSRIINVTSVTHHGGSIDFDNLNSVKGFSFCPSNIKKLKVYFCAKLCNVLITLELARRLAGTGVTVNAVHPGGVDTGLWNDKSSVRLTQILLKPYLKSPRQGAETLIHLAVSPEVEGVSGCYYVDCRQRLPSRLGRDEKVARKLWDVSEKIVGLK